MHIKIRRHKWLIIAITSLFILNILFHLFVIPQTVIYGTGLSRSTVVRSLGRGDWIIPKGMRNISFKLIGKNNPRGVLYIVGSITKDEITRWCVSNGFQNKKITYPMALPKEFSQNLGCEASEIKNGIYKVSALYYNADTNLCYLKVSPVGPRRSQSRFTRIVNLFAVYLTDSWISKEIHEEK